jgi:hypothetical protein
MRLFARGFAIVFFTALNVKLISRGLYLGAFLTGGAISLLWWANAGKASEDKTWAAGIRYAGGAACGTATGMWLGSLL